MTWLAGSNHPAIRLFGRVEGPYGSDWARKFFAGDDRHLTAATLR
jgi:hypothetical protein